MKIIFAGMMALSVMASFAVPTNAEQGTAVGPPTTWHPVDASSSPH
jgi:hypothetical protein